MMFVILGMIAKVTQTLNFSITPERSNDDCGLPLTIPWNSHIVLKLKMSEK